MCCCSSSSGQWEWEKIRHGREKKEGRRQSEDSWRLRQQDVKRGTDKREVRSERKSHRQRGKSVEALSKPNDSVASPGPPWHYWSPQFHLAWTCGASGCLNLIIPPSTCMPHSTCHSPSSLYSQVSPLCPFLSSSLRCPFNTSLGHRKSQSSPHSKITTEF